MTPTATTEAVQPATLRREGAVAVLTLNRPRALNAVDEHLAAAVGAALEEVEGDPAIGCTVVTGAGRAFCAGADLKALAAGRAITAPGHPEWGFAGLVEHPLRKPLIAAVNGFALGGGTEIVLACDLAVLAKDAALGLPEVRRGLFAAAGGLIHLPRQLPSKVCMELALTGEPLSAQDALKWGVVNRVAASDRVLEEAMILADRVAHNAPLAVQASKRMVRRAVGLGSAWDEELWREQDSTIAQLLNTDDAREGTTAFVERRDPVWTGS